VVNKINDEGLFEKRITPPNVEASYPVVQAAGNESVIVAWTDRDKAYYEWVNPDSIIDPAKTIQEETFPIKTELPLSELSSNIDPVCGMHLNEHTLGDTTVYQGKIIGFCSGHCKGKFLKKPEVYVASRNSE